MATREARLVKGLINPTDIYDIVLNNFVGRANHIHASIGLLLFFRPRRVVMRAPSTLYPNILCPGVLCP